MMRVTYSLLDDFLKCFCYEETCMPTQFSCAVLAVKKINKYKYPLENSNSCQRGIK